MYNIVIFRIHIRIQKGEEKLTEETRKKPLIANYYKNVQIQAVYPKTNKAELDPINHQYL